MTASSQVTGGHTYNFSYTYNLTSALTSETYPDGRQVTTNYDAANRVSTLSGKLSTTTTNYVTQSQYWPNGMISSLTRGNNVGLTTQITNRQQLNCEIETNNTIGWELWMDGNCGPNVWGGTRTTRSTGFNTTMAERVIRSFCRLCSIFTMTI
jgi:YD repeat-containing protein